MATLPAAVVANTTSAETAPARSLGRALAWLAVLAPFFFITYGSANYLAGRRPEVASIVFDWERAIPFLEWSIIPYWSIDVFYALALIICSDRAELAGLVRRLLTAQVVAVLCFAIFPLQSTLTPSETSGLTGALFELLGSFDRPFNQAPSLHIALLVVLWAHYGKRLPGHWVWLGHAIAFLIGASVLTTYQHHFIDVPTGALLGSVCLWLWPEDRQSPLVTLRLTRSRKRRRLAVIYGLGGGALALSAMTLGGTGLWLLWPAISLIIVAFNYAAIGPGGFQKAVDGSLSLATRWLLAPYLAAARLNARIWTAENSAPTHILDGVWIGPMPRRRDGIEKTFNAVIDLTAELPGPERAARYFSFPTLDLVGPDADLLSEVARTIEQNRRYGPVLVVCALGYGRSAAAVATWLVAQGHDRDATTAFGRIQDLRPRIAVDAESAAAINDAARPRERATRNSKDRVRRRTKT